MLHLYESLFVGWLVSGVLSWLNLVYDVKLWGTIDSQAWCFESCVPANSHGNIERGTQEPRVCSSAWRSQGWGWRITNLLDFCDISFFLFTLITSIRILLHILPPSDLSDSDELNTFARTTILYGVPVGLGLMIFLYCLLRTLAAIGVLILIAISVLAFYDMPDLSANIDERAWFAVFFVCSLFLGILIGRVLFKYSSASDNDSEKEEEKNKRETAGLRYHLAAGILWIYYSCIHSTTVATTAFYLSYGWAYFLHDLSFDRMQTLLLVILALAGARLFYYLFMVFLGSFCRARARFRRENDRRGNYQLIAPTSSSSPQPPRQQLTTRTTPPPPPLPL